MKPDEFLQALDKMLEEKIPKHLAKIGVPAGYTKCKKCGKMYHKEFGLCPYCVPESDEKTPIIDEDASGGLIDDVIDEE